MAPKLAAHLDAIYLNGPLFKRVEKLYNDREKLGLDDESKWLVERYYKDFVRAGAKLSEADKEKLKKMNSEIAELQTKFSQNVLKEKNAESIPPAGIPLYFGCVAPREWYAGHLARVFNRPEAARTAFLAAKAILEEQLREQPESGLSWSLLGKVYAALGEKEEAVAAGRRACELWPVAKEPYWGLAAQRRLAVIYAWVGEKDKALEQLAAYLDQPSFIHYGDLKLDPAWDSLRGDPRFEALVALLAPKDRPPNPSAKASRALSREQSETRAMSSLFAPPKDGPDTSLPLVGLRPLLSEDSAR